MKIAELRQCWEQQLAERRKQYQEFLRSDDWKRAAARVRERYHNLCIFCRESENLEVHHLSYDLPNRFDAPPDVPQGWLPVADAALVLCCAHCHWALHRVQRP